MARDGCRKLWIFDFDDTLVRTGSRVYLSRACGAQLVLTPAQFALHERAQGDAFDFRDFRALIDPEPIEKVDAIMRAAYRDYGPGAIAVLSARSVPGPIEDYMVAAGLLGTTIVALDTANSEAKGDWVDERLGRGDVDELEFFDDSWKNVGAVRLAAARHPHVRTVVHHVT